MLEGNVKCKINSTLQFASLKKCMVFPLFEGELMKSRNITSLPCCVVWFPHQNVCVQLTQSNNYLPELLSAFTSSILTRPRSPWSAVTIDTSSQQPYRSSTANRLAGMAWAMGPRSSPLISKCNRLFLSINTPRVSPSWRLSRLRRKLSFTYIWKHLL